jgi:hypothetical protein
MTGGLNRELGAHTRHFVRNKFVSAVRITNTNMNHDNLTYLVPGQVTIDLNEHIFGGSPIVTLDSLGAARPDEIPLLAFWVPQGSSFEVPKSPTRNFVFTADFSGCHLIVDQIDEKNYRVYHVQGGGNWFNKEYEQSPYPHGLGIAGALTSSDYGEGTELVRAFAFMKYEGKPPDGRWWIYYQLQNGVGLNYNFNDKTFQAVGAQTIRGAGRVPIADLTKEVPRHTGNIDGHDLPTARNIKMQKEMLPADERW